MCSKLRQRGDFMGVIRNNKRQIRSGWKITIVIFMYLILQGIISIGAGYAIYFIVSAASGGGLSQQELAMKVNQLVRSSPWVRIITQAMDFLTLMLVTYLALRIMDKKRFKDIGLTSVLKNSWDFICGLLLGAVSMTIIFLTLLLTNNITLENGLLEPRFSILTVMGLVLFILVGIKEEVLTRGYCISVLNQMERPYLSIVISSVIFSLLHFFNPNVRAFGLLNIALVGILFGYMFIKSGNLWMPIGYHITWNYFQGDIFGLPVSGGTQKGIYVVKSFNDNLLTGGSFGPEAGILTTVVILIGIILVCRLPTRGNPLGIRK